MITSSRSRTIVCGACLIALSACGGPGLPPVGPQPGEVDVGYGGTRPAEEVTGAVTSVAGERNSGSANVEELLRGRVAGLQVIPKPEGGYRFRIRGVTTLGEAPEPLFVVDGRQVSAADIEDALSGLTRDDIRQVDVLKDLASTSIYGTRGVGGVIIINTRQR